MQMFPLSFNKIAKRLQEYGFKPVRQKGSHVFFQHPDGRTTIVPNHPGEKIGRGLLRKIIRDIDVSVEEFYSGIK